MRIILRFALFVILAWNSGSVLAKSESNASNDITKTNNKMNSEEANRITARLHAIRAMNLSKLNTDQRRDLRNEVNGLKEEMEKNRPGVFIYLSATAIIVILLILLLI